LHRVRCLQRGWLAHPPLKIEGLRLQAARHIPFVVCHEPTIADHQSAAYGHVADALTTRRVHQRGDRIMYRG
jgi:hypothetical protein